MKHIEDVENNLNSEYINKQITIEYLRANPNHIFVFGDNNYRGGVGGAAKLRYETNAYGFITKIAPDHNDNSYYRPENYLPVFESEMKLLIAAIENNPNKTFLISQIGGGLANKYKIWEKVIKYRIPVLEQYKNVIFLFDIKECK